MALVNLWYLVLTVMMLVLLSMGHGEETCNGESCKGLLQTKKSGPFSQLAGNVPNVSLFGINPGEDEDEVHKIFINPREDEDEVHVKPKIWGQPILEPKLKFWGNGCCRYDGWWAKPWGYVTEEACLSLCELDDDCVAVDVARPTDELSDCYLFFGNVMNFRTECGTENPTEKCWKKPCTATVYQHQNFEGWRATFGAGSYDLEAAEEKGFVNNDATSIMVGQGCIAVVYQHQHFAGWAAQFVPGSYSVDAAQKKGMESDQATSIKVIRQFIKFTTLGPGKCVTSSGEDPEHLYVHDAGDECKQMCADDANCYGYSRYMQGNGRCLLWMQEDLKEGGEEWGAASCVVKTFEAQ